MDVILLKDVEELGLRGDVVNVSRGYMRNYLGPRRLAEPATPARVAELERREAMRARQEARSVEQAEQIASTLRKTVLRFEVRAGAGGTLFGSVTPTDVADELWRTRKVRVDRRKIALSEPIKRVGRYDVPIDLFENVRVEVKTLVVPEGGELPPEDEASGEDQLVTGEAADGEVLAASEALPAEDEAAASVAGAPAEPDFDEAGRDGAEG